MQLTGSSQCVKCGEVYPYVVSDCPVCKGACIVLKECAEKTASNLGLFGEALEYINGIDLGVETSVNSNGGNPLLIPISELEDELYQTEYTDYSVQQRAFLVSRGKSSEAEELSRIRVEAQRLYDKGIDYEKRSKGLFFKKRNFRLAVSWWTKSAELNYSLAQKKLGDVYYDLDNGYWNPDEALKWYLLAAKQGNCDAQYEVGKQCECYGKLKDDPEEAKLYALKWYRLSAEQGHAGSLSHIASYVEFGRSGVPKDEQKAYALYQQALDGGFVYAASDLMRMHEKHPDYPIDYRKIAPALKEASVNDISSQRMMAILYENGWGVEKNLELALQYYRCAASDDGVSGASVVRVMRKLGYA